MSIKESDTNKNYSNAYFKRPTMSVSDSVASAKDRNKKQDERKKEINKAAKKYKVGGGGADRYGPHKVDVNRRATESLFGRGPIQEKIIKFADKFNKKQKEKKKNKKKK